MGKFRIYGDNVIECERTARLILERLGVGSPKAALANNSILVYEATLGGERITLELLPGFNKSGRRRWERNVFDALKEAGSILDETPDVVITRVEDGKEEILLAIEFCSALQAGNQAWQRSGRAFSVGRTGCPYIYVVDFVKYELDSASRERKALRFPNPLVPYSYIVFSRDRNLLAVQAYAKSEEFRQEGRLADFPADAFALETVADFIIAKMRGEDTGELEEQLLAKNRAVVDFLTDSNEIRLPNEALPFKKKIAEKSVSGHAIEVRDLGEESGFGVSRDFPFGVIPALKRPGFADGLKRIYPDMDGDLADGISQSSEDLLFCMIKGFKPRGDDNRPDRGVLPLAAMLFPASGEVLTFIYGPLLRDSYRLLRNDMKALSIRSGFWNVILSLSDFIIVDSPLVGDPPEQAELFIDNRDFKAEALEIKPDVRLEFPTFDARPLSFHEDDVDAAIHYLFAHVFSGKCFEGMCNPPGGDWSGLSLIVPGGKEVRWLSLPRVSGEGKRPDHVIEVFREDEKPALLIIESKENSADLEPNVGPMLVRYVKSLMDFVPNVEKTDGEWHKCESMVPADDFVMISGAAYLKATAQSPESVFIKTGCDMLFILDPQAGRWKLEICADSDRGRELRDRLFSGRSEIEIK